MTVVLTQTGSTEWAEQFIIRDSSGNLDVGPTQNALPRSDIVSAKVIAEHHENEILYGTQTAQWYQWNGVVHVLCNNGDIERLVHVWAHTLSAALDVVQDHYELLAASATTPQQRDNVMKQYRDGWKMYRQYRDRLFSDSGQRAVISQLRSMCSTDESDFDASGRYFVVQNGVINMDAVEKTHSVVLLDHDPRRKLTKSSEVVWDPTAHSPWWEWYLTRSLPDPEVRRYVQRWAGSALLGKPNSKGLVNLIGPQDSGKSVFIDTILSVFGDYGKMVRAATFLAKKNGDSGYDLHELRGARFVAASEPGKGKSLDDDIVKSITGSDSMRTREPYGRFVPWRPQCTIFIASNSPMKMDTADGALLNRIKPILFPKSFRRGSDVPPEERAELRLSEYLSLERAGILRWLMDGLVDFLNQGLGDEPESVVESRHTMAVSIDTSLQWLEDAIEEGTVVKCDSTVPDYKCLSVNNAYQQYTMWCALAGERYPFGRKGFADNIGRLYTRKKSGGPTRFIGLKERDHDDS